MPPAETESAIGRVVVVSVVREDAAWRALEVAEWLVEQGLGVIELTASTPGWHGALATLRTRALAVLAGAGTLRTREEAERAVGSGAAFLVSPCPAPAVREVAEAAGVAFVEGGLTPGEVLAASDRGIAKLFPAHVGGTGLLR